MDSEKRIDTLLLTSDFRDCPYLPTAILTTGPEGSSSGSGESNGIDSDTEDAIYAQMYFQDSLNFNSTSHLPKYTHTTGSSRYMYEPTERETGAGSAFEPYDYPTVSLILENSQPPKPKRRRRRRRKTQSPYVSSNIELKRKRKRNRPRKRNQEKGEGLSHGGGGLDSRELAAAPSSASGLEGRGGEGESGCNAMRKKIIRPSLLLAAQTYQNQLQETRDSSNKQEHNLEATYKRKRTWNQHPPSKRTCATPLPEVIIISDAPDAISDSGSNLCTLDGIQNAGRRIGEGVSGPGRLFALDSTSSGNEALLNVPSHSIVTHQRVNKSPEAKINVNTMLRKAEPQRSKPQLVKHTSPPQSTHGSSVQTKCQSPSFAVSRDFLVGQKHFARVSKIEQDVDSPQSDESNDEGEGSESEGFSNGEEGSGSDWSTSGDKDGSPQSSDMELCQLEEGEIAGSTASNPGPELCMENWELLSKDIMGRDAYDKMMGVRTGRYYAARIRKCTNCKQRGHMEKNCPHPMRHQTCYLCAGLGHISSRCHQELCQYCYQPKHRGRSCSVPWASTRTQCNRCFMSGHHAAMCTDKWRQFHNTTHANSYLVRISPREQRQNRRVFCYNCARQGHFGFECTQSSPRGWPLPHFPLIGRYDAEWPLRDTRTMKRGSSFAPTLPLTKRAREDTYTPPDSRRSMSTHKFERWLSEPHKQRYPSPSEKQTGPWFQPSPLLSSPSHHPTPSPLLPMPPDFTPRNQPPRIPHPPPLPTYRPPSPPPPPPPPLPRPMYRRSGYMHKEDFPRTPFNSSSLERSFHEDSSSPSPSKFYRQFSDIDGQRYNSASSSKPSWTSNSDFRRFENRGGQLYSGRGFRGSETTAKALNHHFTGQRRRSYGY